MSINIAKYWATVTNNVDPENRGRISVACVGLLGDEETELPMFVEPVHDWGWFYIPDVGELVEIEVIESSDEDEQHGQMSIDNLDIKWRSKRDYKTKGRSRLFRLLRHRLFHHLSMKILHQRILVNVVDLPLL